jgi:DNA-binding response OmpR family regulator
MAIKATILLVVGGEDLLMSIRDCLESNDISFVVECAKDASECLKYVERKNPDLILIDLTLADMDGFTLRATLKRTDAKDVPVIYLSEKFDIGMTRKVGMLTADDFILKPIDMPELFLRIQELMVWHCYRRTPRLPQTAEKRRIRKRNHNIFPQK